MRHTLHPQRKSLTSAPGCGMGSPSSTNRTWCRALIMWCSAPAGMASAKRCRRKTLGGASFGTIGRGRPPSGGAWSASRCVWGLAWRQRSVRRWITVSPCVPGSCALERRRSSCTLAASALDTSFSVIKRDTSSRMGLQATDTEQEQHGSVE